MKLQFKVQQFQTDAVVTDESYKEFVEGLQKEIADSLTARPRQASVAFFTGKTIRTEAGEKTIDERTARAIYAYLLKNDYVDEDDYVTERYKADKAAGTLAPATSEVLKPRRADLPDHEGWHPAGLRLQRGLD